MLITSDAQPMPINTAHQVQTDQCTVLRFQDSFIFHPKNVRMNYRLLRFFIMCFLCEKVIAITNVHNQSRHYAVLYIRTDEQKAVFVIADDTISTIYLTRHQCFSYLKISAAKCQCL